MNYWTKLSIEYASQRSYLDDLFHVYPTIPEGIRDIHPEFDERVKHFFDAGDNVNLIDALLDGNLFPIKDSYTSFLRKDRKALQRNPKTVDRLAGRLYEMGFEEMKQRYSQPKETNRQIGPMFRNWLLKKSLGLEPICAEDFLSTKDNAILDSSDNECMSLAKEHFNYNRNKGLDLVARFNGKYVLGEAKFITDEGGHQNAQFEDAIKLVQDTSIKAVRIAILDGILYLKSRSKMHRFITDEYNDFNIMSSLLLRDFLYQL